MKKHLLFLVLMLLILSSCKKDDSTTDLITGQKEDSGNNEFNDEPTKNTNDLLQYCLGAQMARYRIMCAALANKDPEMCKEITEEKDAEQRYQRAICVTQVAIATADYSICDKYETLVSEGGSYIDLGCRMNVAIGTLDAKECEKLEDENERNGCIYNVNFMAGKTEVSECKESGCVFNYAWVHKDAKACEAMTKLSEDPSIYSSFEVACKAMLSGNAKDCDSLKSVGVNEWYYCKTKAQYKQIMPSPGVYNLDVCEDDSLCYKMALGDMAAYMARQ